MLAGRTSSRLVKVLIAIVAAVMGYQVVLLRMSAGSWSELDLRLSAVKEDGDPVTLCDSVLKGDSCSLLLNRVATYCSREVPVDGLEGRLSQGGGLMASLTSSLTTSTAAATSAAAAGKYTLKRLALTVRHGDRSTLNVIPGEKVRAEQGGRGEYLEPSAVGILPKLSRFRLHAIPEPNNHTFFMADPLSQVELMTNLDQPRNRGQLTSLGFVQLHTLGSYLGESYADFVRSIEGPAEVYVRSTSYDRTVQSVASLLSGMLPHIGGAALESRVVIHSHMHDADETMHGIGYRSSSKSNDGKGEVVSEGKCTKAARLAVQQLHSFQKAPQIDDFLRSRFSEEATHRPVTDIADAVLPRLCHRRSLPCSSEIVRGCIEAGFFEKVMSESDRFYCDRFSGPQGGAEATKLAFYPFMQDVLAALTGRSTQQPGAKLSVFSGHDTVIAPVLAALGVYRSDFCFWPSYASRIAFELWEATDGSPPVVRVVYNGLDVTSRIPACDGQALCPLEDFERQINGLLGNHATLEDACQWRE